jgi:hypothetical protein
MFKIDEIGNLSTPELREFSLGSSKALAKAHAINELARRALEDESLLGDVCRAIGNDRTWVTRGSPPLGYLGAFRILDSGNDKAVRHLLEEMNLWLPADQEDLIRVWAGRGRFTEAIKHFRKRFGWNASFVDDASR